MSDACPVTGELPAFLLGALDPRAREDVEAHLGSCPACLDELSALRAGRDALTLGVPSVTPPPAVRAAVMREVRREAELFAAARTPERAPRPGRRWWWRWESITAATAAAACGLALGVFVVGGGEELDTRTAPAQIAAGVPDGAAGALVLTGDTGRLRVRGLPAPAPNRIYQVWVQSGDGRPRPTDALFDVDRRGVGTALVPRSLRDGDQVLVTSEPAGGSSTPTRAPVLSVRV